MPADLPTFRHGDLLGFSGRGLVSAGINILTRGWPFLWPRSWAGLSHVGIIGFSPDDTSSLALYESTTGSKLPCLFVGGPVHGVQCHVIADRLAEYQGLVWHYPMTDAARSFFNEEAAQAELWDACKRPYDYHQAFAAQSTLLGWLLRRCCRCDAAARWYCSELVAGVWRAGFGMLADVQWNPNSLARMAQRIAIVEKRRRLK